MAAPQDFITALLDPTVLQALRDSARGHDAAAHFRQFRLTYGGRRESDAITVDSVPDLEAVEPALALDPAPEVRRLSHLNLTGESPAPEIAPGYWQVEPVFIESVKPGATVSFVPPGSDEYERRRAEQLAQRNAVMPQADNEQAVFLADVGLCTFCGCAPHGHEHCQLRDAPQSPRYEPLVLDGSALLGADPWTRMYSPGACAALPDVGFNIPKVVLQFFANETYAPLIHDFGTVDHNTLGAATDRVAVELAHIDDFLRQNPLHFEDCAWFLDVKEYLVYRLLAFMFLASRFLDTRPVPHWPSLDTPFFTIDEGNSMIEDIRMLIWIGEKYTLIDTCERFFETVLEPLKQRLEMLRALRDAGMFWDEERGAPVADLFRRHCDDRDLWAFHLGEFVSDANDFELKFGHLVEL
ncbi:hypothetical protein AURDEDRAFT_129110 [Auricularia subglabra TFB-10046 SS5]|nr:hypothetical protein AURDEDRAFT_129110 [Auricularia subglabra TFB-10046 SS5]